MTDVFVKKYKEIKKKNRKSMCNIYCITKKSVGLIVLQECLLKENTENSLKFTDSNHLLY